MQSETSRIHVLLGALILLGFAGIVVGLAQMMRSDPRLFGTTVDLLVRMPERTSLQIGDPVQIDGIEVGTVHSIRREVRGSETNFLVRARLQANAEPITWLGRASRARARTVNLLGDTVLAIQGDPQGRGLAPEHVIAGDRTPGFDDLLADMRTSIASVQRIVGSIEGALAAEDETGQPRVEIVARAIAELTSSLADITASVNLRIPRVLEDIEQTAARLRELIAALAGPSETAGERPALAVILSNLVAATENASSVTASLRDLFSGGVDAEVLASLIRDLQNSAQNLKAITSDIREITAKVRNFFGQ